jgi:hypothetical protein
MVPDAGGAPVLDQGTEQSNPSCSCRLEPARSQTPTNSAENGIRPAKNPIRRGRPGVAFCSDHLFSDSLPGKNFSTVAFSVATFLRVDWHLVLVAGCAPRILPMYSPREPRKRDLDVLFCDLLHLGFGHGREVGGLGGGDALVDSRMMGLQIFG